MTNVTADEARKTSWFKRSKAEREAIFEEREARRLDRWGVSFEGATLKGGRVSYKGQVVNLPARATVETAGELRKRISATRLVLGGGIGGLLFKKKVDDRELYLTVEGEDGGAFVVDVNPKKGREAREFAAKVNSAR